MNFDTHRTKCSENIYYKLPSLHKSSIIPLKDTEISILVTLDVTVQVLHNNYIMIVIQ